MLWQIHGTPKDLSLRFSTSGDNTILTAPAGCNMFIHSLTLIPSANMTVKFKCGARTVADMDLLAFMTYSMADMPGMDGQGSFECKTGEAFIINISSASQVTGSVTYSYTDTTI